MGLATAGLAFKRTSSTPEESEFVRLAFGESFYSIFKSDIQNHHDTRIAGNMAIETKGEFVFVYSSEFADRILFEGESIDPSVASALGNPGVIVTFCHYDSGDSFGYVISENGIRTRSRIYSLERTRDEGVPKAFELSWVNAKEELEEGEPPAYRNLETGELATEGYVTAMMLRVAIANFFEGCPWDEWNYKSRFNYYRRKLPEPGTKMSNKDPWWRFW